MRPLRADAPCPCGSGARYGACHGLGAAAATPPVRASAPAAPPIPRPRVGPTRFAAALATLDALGPEAPSPAHTPGAPRPLLIVEDFLSPETCRLLIEGFERNIDRLDEKAADPYWRSRLLYIQALGHEPAMQAAMREAQRGFVRELADFYGCREALYSDTIHIVRWREGQSMEAHADNAHPDGSPNEYPWRSFASVAYLNDDYEGGEIYFSKLGRSLKPRAGTLVGFTGGLEHFHGVTEVTRGTRYTMPAWHTHDAERRDKSFD